MVGLEPQSLRVIEGSGAAADQSEPPAEHVGAFLREARANTGCSLADIAATLRIRAKFLQAIEDGRYEDLPGPTYAAGFIRSYADYLGLDTAALLAQFKTEPSGAEGQPDLEFPAPSTVGWFPTGTVVASCAVLAAAVFGGWFYLQTKDTLDVAAVPPPPGATPAVTVKETGEQVAQARVAGATESALPATPADDAAGTPAGVEADNLVASADQVGYAPPATNGETTATDGEQPYRLPVPITALVALDPVATESDLKPPEPVEAARTATSSSAADSAAAPTEIVEPAVAIEPAEAVARTELTEPTVATVDELTPVSVDTAEPPASPAAQPRPAAPPAPAAREPVVQVATLPAIPASSSDANSSDDGRTYGVVNQRARVVIGATADSWVQVLDDKQNVVLTRLLRAGDRYLVPNRSDLVMLTGNAGGLTISVDGEQVPRIGSDGAILHNVRLDVELLKAGRAVIQ
jgi:cytoskeletal protein RodZ